MSVQLINKQVNQLSRDLANLTDRSSPEFHQRFTVLAKEVLDASQSWNVDAEIRTLSVIGGMLGRDPGIFPFHTLVSVSEEEWTVNAAVQLQSMVESPNLVTSLSQIASIRSFSPKSRSRAIELWRIANLKHFNSYQLDSFILVFLTDDPSSKKTLAHL